MQPTTKPAVGRVVHFYDAGSETGLNPRLAMIAHVHTDTCVNIALWDHNGKPIADPPTSVELINGQPDNTGVARVVWPNLLPAPAAVDTPADPGPKTEPLSDPQPNPVDEANAPTNPAPPEAGAQPPAETSSAGLPAGPDQEGTDKTAAMPAEEEEKEKSSDAPPADNEVDG